MIITYIEQLKTIADETGWDLREACIDSGISDVSYYRWINGTTQARETEVIRVAEYMEMYAR